MTNSSTILGSQNLLLDRYPLTQTPKTKPVTDAVVKAHLLVSHSSDDALIDLLTWAAVEEVENRGSIALINQSRRQYVGVDVELAEETIALSRGPVVSVTGVYYLDSEGAQQTLATDKYRVTQGGVRFGTNLPTMVKGPDKLWIDYIAGHGTAVANIPSAWQQCILFLTMHKYELRGDDPGKYSDGWERAFDRLITVAGAQHRGY